MAHPGDDPARLARGRRADWRGLVRNKAAIAEFEGSLILSMEPRPVMSRPPMPRAAKRVVDEVRLLLEGGASAEDVADWAVARAERYAAYHARPVFDMDGQGPQCSLCAAIWPLCGHHHFASGLDDDEEGDAP